MNIANDVSVVDSSKKVKTASFAQVEKDRESPSEEKTIEYLKRSEKLANRFTGKDPSSLGLHPAVYFYALNFRHQPTAVLAIGLLIMELEREDKFVAFTRVRREFEDFLIAHKMFINQLTGRFGSMAKGFRPMKEYFRFVLDEFLEGKDATTIELDLKAHPRFQFLVKERPITTKKAKSFSSPAKDVVVLGKVLEMASICELCGARIDLKAMHIDHITDKKKGGLGTTENARLLHPFCDSTYKHHQERKVR